MLMLFLFKVPHLSLRHQKVAKLREALSLIEDQILKYQSGLKTNKQIKCEWVNNINLKLAHATFSPDVFIRCSGKQQGIYEEG